VPGSTNNVNINLKKMLLLNTAVKIGKVPLSSNT